MSHSRSPSWRVAGEWALSAQVFRCFFSSAVVDGALVKSERAYFATSQMTVTQFLSVWAGRVELEISRGGED